MPRLQSALILLAVLLTPALALSRGPGGTDEAEAEANSTVEVVKRAAQAQGDISPQTKKALQEARGGFGMGGQPAQGAPAAPKAGSGKAIYGDIIIHK